jgi:5-methyltetrahydropteroyltriglutamate--homocysteine methyltransferase
MSQTHKIITTHVGSLPRPPELLALMQRKYDGEKVDEKIIAAAIRDSVEDVVKRQIEVGVDIVSDGEFSKPSYAHYVTERLTGFGGSFKGHVPADLRDFRSYSEHLVKTGGILPRGGGACCKGEIRVKDTSGVKTDIENLTARSRNINPPAPS